MKTIIITLAFVLASNLLANTVVLANGKNKQAMAKSPPPIIQIPGEDRTSCLNRVASECEAKNWTKLGKRACYRVNVRKCR